jgi:hypothetical protein
MQLEQAINKRRVSGLESRMGPHGRPVRDEIEPKQECLESFGRTVDTSYCWFEVYAPSQYADVQGDELVVYDPGGP